MLNVNDEINNTKLPLSPLGQSIPNQNLYGPKATLDKN